MIIMEQNSISTGECEIPFNESKAVAVFKV